MHEVEGDFADEAGGGGKDWISDIRWGEEEAGFARIDDGEDGPDDSVAGLGDPDGADIDAALRGGVDKIGYLGGWRGAIG